MEIVPCVSKKQKQKQNSIKVAGKFQNCTLEWSCFFSGQQGRERPSQSMSSKLASPSVIIHVFWM